MRARLLYLVLVAGCGGSPPEPVTPGTDLVGLPERTTPVRSTRVAAPVTATRTLADPPPPRAGHGKRIDLDVKDADLADVLRLIAETANVNIVLEGDARARITIRMKQVPWDEALEAIARSKGYRVERDGNVLVVK